MRIIYSILISVFSFTFGFSQIFVDADATGANDGSSWTNAFNDLQTALTSGSFTVADEIWIAEGTYKPHVSDRNVSFELTANAKLYGGFNGTETMLTQRDSKLHPVILSGDLNDDDNAVILNTEPTRQENSYNIIYVNGAATGIVVDGVTISDANANGAPGRTYSGAIVMNVGYGLTISSIFRDVVIENNTGVEAAVFRGFSPRLINSSAVLEFFVENSIIRNNHCVSFPNCVFTGTHVNNSGQNVYDRISGGFKNTLFYNNISVNQASCIYNRVSGGNGNYSPLQVINCTFSNNTGGLNGNVVHMSNAGTGLYKNNIIYGNNAGSPVFFSNSGAIANSWVNNIVSDPVFGENVDPLFLDASNHDYRLDCSGNSPAINTGNTAGFTLPNTDLAGLSRIVDILDKGAYEYREQLDISATATELCEGEQLTLTALNSTGTVWDNGVNDGIAFSPSASQTYTFTGVDMNNCAHSKSIDIYITSLNEKSISATPTSTCNGGTVDVTVANADINISYSLINNTSGLVVDGPITGDGNNLTFTTDPINATTTYSVIAESTSPVGLDFDGSNDYISSDAKLPTTNTFSIETWVYPRATNFKRIISSYSGSGAVLAGEIIIDTYHATNNGRGLRFVISGAGNATASANAANVLTLNTWNHIAAVFDNGVLNLYANGILVSTTTAPFSSFPGANNYAFNIGEDRLLGAAEYFNGKIDDIRLWNKALSVSDVQNGMATCLEGNEVNLIANFNLSVDEIGGTSVTDITSNAFSGTLINMDPATDWVLGAYNCIPNQTECSKTMAQTVTVTTNDVTAPVADIATLTDLTSSCQITSLVAPTATDNCAGTITGTHNTVLPITTNTTIIWTYNDGNGNSSTQTQNAIIVDNTAPVANIASLPALNAQCSITSLTAPTATDNCAGTISGTHNVTLPITTQGTTMITWTYNDGNGNSSTQTQNVVINDVTAPVANLATLPAINAQCSVISLSAPTATDNCAGTITGIHNATLPITTQGTTVVTWTYNDGNGNSTTQTQSVIINDNTAPVANIVTLPAITSQCSITALTSPTATDNCSGTVNGTHNVTLPITTQGTTAVTWTYTDANGNSSTQLQNIVIDDNVAPVANSASLPDLTGQCSVSSLTPPTATDNCTGTITGTHNAILPITSNSTIIWSYDDGNGNISTQNQSVVLNDNTAPVPNSASLATINSQCEVTSLIAPTATDNCFGAVTGTHAVTLPISSSTTIVWTYTDGAGNSVTQNQSVVINDVTAPIADIASLSDIMSQCEVITLPAPTATDNCAGVITGMHNAIFPITSNTTVTWTYDDGNGNTSTQTQNVVINDNTAPIADLASLMNLTGQCEISSLVAPTATDNCNGTIIGTTSTTLPISASTTITWTYDDGNGNTSTQIQEVVIDDNIAPVADAVSLPDLTASCAITNLVAPTATDNCNGTITGTTSAMLPISTSGVIIWTFDDGNGNASTQTQNVLINDIINPVPDAVSLTDITSSCPLTSLTAPTATDNCSGVITGVSDAVFPITGSVLVTWTFTDGNGNSVTQSQNIDVTDNIAPIPDQASLTAIETYCEISALTPPTATDNCSGTITGTHNANLPITADMTITWTYTDAAGNVVTQDQSVTINTINTTVTEDENTLTATNTTASDYQWVDCGNGNQPISGATGQSFTPTFNGSFAVIVTEGNCSETSACTTISTVGIDALSKMIDMRLQPNPTFDNVTIVSNYSIEKVEIYTLTGELVQSENSESFKVGNLSNGVYLVKVITTNGFSTLRLIKN